MVGRMALRPVARRAVPDQVFEQLLVEVIDGGLRPGESLPSERELAETLGVSRAAVREALQRLSQTRLVEVRHGGSTKVRDFRRAAGLDLLGSLLVRDGSIDPSVARSILEARLVVGPAVAALAAQRHPDGIGGQLQRAIEALAAEREPVGWQLAALAFWDVVVDAADSIVFQLMFNSMRATYEPTIEVLSALMSGELNQLAAYGSLADAIVAGDADAARQAAEKLLTPSTNALLSAFAELEKPR
ncbi:MAG: GntR family transcriptional regulator, transcriptional repressor for pyruvate dehydrogenase complex [Pseudonocardiales bacterium]|jgi:DNA-binding FadR family transcriptional regulator|nr:GntR family transcriptional regulator, transcriptional repressor for pyruvate dehydrogenase complex [Pseudonocardiales bacterium]